MDELFARLTPEQVQINYSFVNYAIEIQHKINKKKLELKIMQWEEYRIRARGSNIQKIKLQIIEAEKQITMFYLDLEKQFNLIK